MIKILCATTAFLFTGIIYSPRAEAGPGHPHHASFRSGGVSCGSVVYTRRYVRSFDCYSRPVFAYARIPIARGHILPPRTRYYSARPRVIAPVIPRAIPCAPPRITVRGHRPLGRSSGISFGLSFGGRR